MKRLLIALVSLICVTTLYAQKYIVDAVVGDYTVATTDEYKWNRDFLQQSTYEAAVGTGSTIEKEIEIPNGTEVTVETFSRSWKKEKNTHVTARIAYEDGNTYYIHARDLVFSPNNPKGTFNALDTIDFSPNKFKMNYVDETGERVSSFINTLDVHSEEGQLLYSYSCPTCILIFIGASLVLLLLALLTGKSFFIRLAIYVTPLFMIAAVAVEGYLVFRLGGESLWFIDSDFYSKTTCVLRSIPLIATIALQIASYMLYCNLLPAKDGKKVTGSLSLVSTLVVFIPAVVAGYFLTIYITGYDRATSDEALVSKCFMIWGVLIFLMLLIWPTIYYSIKLDAKRIFPRSQFLLGLSTSAFMVIYWIGTILLIIILIFALIKLFLAILAQVFLWAVLLFTCSKLPADAFRTPNMKTVFLDKNGGRHTSALSAEQANARIDANK